MTLLYSTCTPVSPSLLVPYIIVRVNHSRNHIKVACISNTLTHPPLIWEKEISTNSNRKGKKGGNPPKPPNDSTPNCQQEQGGKSLLGDDRDDRDYRDGNNTRNTPGASPRTTQPTCVRSTLDTRPYCTRSYYSKIAALFGSLHRSSSPSPSPPFVLYQYCTNCTKRTVHTLPMNTPFALHYPHFQRPYSPQMSQWDTLPTCESAN